MLSGIVRLGSRVSRAYLVRSSRDERFSGWRATLEEENRGSDAGKIDNVNVGLDVDVDVIDGLIIAFFFLFFFEAAERPGSTFLLDSEATEDREAEKSSKDRRTALRRFS